MNEMDPQELIARRVAQEIRPGTLVNLGIGLPTQVGRYLPPGMDVYLQAENGIVVLGGLQVDESGRLANWMVPGKLAPGMGGAMDLVTGARRVVVAMFHTAKGAPKIVRRLELPLTSTRRVDLIVTEMAVIEPTDAGLVL